MSVNLHFCGEKYQILTFFIIKMFTTHSSDPKRVIVPDEIGAKAQQPLGLKLTSFTDEHEHAHKHTHAHLWFCLKDCNEM